jgi:hypothetical protein
MSFFGHREIFRNDPGATLSDYARAHRPDESPVGCSSAACSPASPASALPTGSQCALNSSCWSTDFHRTANCVLTVCLTPGGRPTLSPRSVYLGKFVLALMTRTLSDVTYSKGNIASGKCTGCGQLFTASPAVLALHDNPEWGVVGAFGGHDCTPSTSKPVA